MGNFDSLRTVLRKPTPFIEFSGSHLIKPKLAICFSTMCYDAQTRDLKQLNDNLGPLPRCALLLYRGKFGPIQLKDAHARTRSQNKIRKNRVPYPEEQIHSVFDFYLTFPPPKVPHTTRPFRLSITTTCLRTMVSSSSPPFPFHFVLFVPPLLKMWIACIKRPACIANTSSCSVLSFPTRVPFSDPLKRL